MVKSKVWLAFLERGDDAARIFTGLFSKEEYAWKWMADHAMLLVRYRVRSARKQKIIKDLYRKEQYKKLIAVYNVNTKILGEMFDLEVYTPDEYYHANPIDLEA